MTMYTKSLEHKGLKIQLQNKFTFQSQQGNTETGKKNTVNLIALGHPANKYVSSINE